MQVATCLTNGLCQPAKSRGLGGRTMSRESDGSTLMGG